MAKLLKNLVIYVICCGANKTKNIEELVSPLHEQGANTYIFPTASGYNFMITEAIEDKGIIRAEKDNTVSQLIPEEDIVIIAPCTFNTFNKIACGIADSYPLSIIQNAIGCGKKCIIAPSMNINFWNHKTTQNNLKYLKEFSNINIIYPEYLYSENGEIDRLTMAPFEKILDTVYYENVKIKYKHKKINIDIKKELEENIESFQKTGVLLAEGNYITGSAGFLAKRITSGILITRSGANVGNLTKDDLTLITDHKNNIVSWSGKHIPSSESPLALEIFDKFNCNAIIHGHCKDITYNYKKNLYLSNGYVKYGEWGELAKIQNQLNNYKKVILKLHGELLISENLEKCFLNYVNMRNLEKNITKKV